MGSGHRSEKYVTSPDDPRVLKALSFLHGGADIEPQGFGTWRLPEPGPKLRAGLRLAYVEFHDRGGCVDLQARWKQLGVEWVHCWESHGHFLQVMWLDLCIRTVRAAPQQYDYVVRTRPDIAMLSDIVWSFVPTGSVGVVDKPGTFADWFFIMPQGLLDAFWVHVPRFYYAAGMELGEEGAEKLVEFTIWYHQKEAPWQELQQMTPEQRKTRGWMSGGPLPVSINRDTMFTLLPWATPVIVRSEQVAWCEMLSDPVLCGQWVIGKGANKLLEVP